MNMELHSTGASFVAAKEHDNPRDLVLKAIKAGPSLTRKERFEDFRSLLQERSEEYQRAVDWYFFVNMHDYFTTNRSRRPDPVERTQAREQQIKMVESIKQQIVMLEFPMTNGKLLGDCTGAELSTMSNRYQKLAERVGKAKTVRSVLNEDQVKAILK